MIPTSISSYTTNNDWLDFYDNVNGDAMAKVACVAAPVFLLLIGLCVRKMSRRPQEQRSSTSKSQSQMNLLGSPEAISSGGSSNVATPIDLVSNVDTRALPKIYNFNGAENETPVFPTPHPVNQPFTPGSPGADIPTAWVRRELDFSQVVKDSTD